MFIQNWFDTTETQKALTLSTLLDPRFKMTGFYNGVEMQASVRLLITQHTQVLRCTLDTLPDSPLEQQPSTSAVPEPANAGNSSSTGNSYKCLIDKSFVMTCHFCFSETNLWASLDRRVWSKNAKKCNRRCNSWGSVVHYWSIAERSDDPLAYLKNHQKVYPDLFKLPKQLVCNSASSVPCEHVFSTQKNHVETLLVKIDLKI